ncbi:MAG: hypothetical protein J5737_06755 [Bacteroidales bacterium]|nr:hypothetical protein [Bacteroidales bacterium]
MRKVSLLLLAASLLLACNPQNPEPEVAGAITLESNQTIALPAAGGSADIAFSANKAWTASSDADWLQVEPKSGESGEHLVVSLAASENQATEERSASVTLVCEEDVKTVPVKQSAAEAPDVPYSWPDDEDSFDYGLDPGESRTGAYDSAVLVANGYNSSDRKIPKPILMDGITYGGPGITFYGNRMTTEKVNKEWSEDYPEIVPSSRYFSLKINKPGYISFFQSIVDEARIPTYYLALVTTKNGVTTAKLVDEVVPEHVTSERPGGADRAKYGDYFVSLYVREADLKGITSPATVYLFHRWTAGNTCTVHYYPLTWTSSEENTPDPARKQKILLAGDSTCTEYGESSAPQEGWGQRLAEALGGDARVENHAHGGESTKSFLNNGRWDALRAGVFGGDLVLIQFGHNERKTDEAYHTEPYTTYKENLKKMLDDVHERNGVPVLLTSICTRTFNTDGTLRRSLGDYPKAMREVAAETGTPLIDIEEQTYQWLSSLGPEGSVPYYLMDKRDPAAMDNTHLTKEGAQAVAQMVAKGLRSLGLWQ